MAHGSLSTTIPSAPDTRAQHLPRLVPQELPLLPPEPLVSILVGNYNYARYLPESIESVLAQTYGRWELIVCDDGSTDNSVQVIQSYVQRDERIRLVLKENGGHPSSLNAAFAQASGQIICLLDSDDIYLPSKLEQVVGACHANPDCGLIVHRVIRVNQDRRREGVFPLSDLPHGWYGNELLETGGLLPFLPPTSGLTLRREVADQLFPLRTEPPFRMSPDQIVMRLAPLVTKVAALPNALAEYRLHGSNTYAQHTFTSESVEKELALLKALWSEQRKFLAKLDLALAGQLEPLETNPQCAFLSYLDAKLRNHPSMRRHHAEYVALCRRASKPKWFTLWRLSLYFPEPLFRGIVDLLLGQNALKQMVARVRKLA